MSLSMIPLLLHSSAIPADARLALLEADRASPAARAEHLEAAARALYRGADVDCSDARELVGLPAGGC